MSNQITFNLTGNEVSYVIIDTSTSYAVTSYDEPQVSGQLDCARAISDYFHWKAGTLAGASLSFGQRISGETPKKYVPSDAFIENIKSCLPKKDYDHFIMTTLIDALDNNDLDRVNKIVSHIKTIDAKMLLNPSVINNPEILKTLLNANKTSESELIKVLDKFPSIFARRQIGTYLLDYVYGSADETFEILFDALHRIPTKNPRIYHLPLDLARKAQLSRMSRDFKPNLPIDARIHGCSAAMNAVMKGAFDVLRGLIEIGADVGHKSAGHWESAPLALLMQHHHEIELENDIVDIGMKRNPQDFPFFLNIAIKFKRHELINKLLSTYPEGCINPRSFIEGLSPFDYALDGHSELIPMLIIRGRDQDLRNLTRFLMIALKHGRKDVFDSLWVAGARYGDLDFSKENPADFSMINLQIINRMIEVYRFEGVPIPPFFLRVAISKGDRLMVKPLLKAGVSMNEADYPQGETPLEHAVKLGFDNLINAILKKMDKVKDRALCKSVIMTLRNEQASWSVSFSQLMGMNMNDYEIMIKKIEHFLEPTKR